MTDEQLSTTLRVWLRQRDALPQDPERTAAHVLARLPGVGQRDRWRLLPSLGRAHPPGPWADGRSIDRVPIVTRRTVAMLSPVKAVIVGSLVAVGGLLLVAQPLDQPAVSGPGAASAEPPVAVSVAQECADVLAVPVVCTWTAADPRLAGTFTHKWAEPMITARLLDDDMGIGWADAILEAPEGDWSGHLYAVWADPAQLFVVLSGAGAYDGWQFLASTIDSEVAGNSPWTGVIYQGEPPPFGPVPEALAQ